MGAGKDADPVLIAAEVNGGGEYLPLRRAVPGAVLMMRKTLPALVSTVPLLGLSPVITSSPSMGAGRCWTTALHPGAGAGWGFRASSRAFSCLSHSSWPATVGKLEVKSHPAKRRYTSAGQESGPPRAISASLPSAPATYCTVSPPGVLPGSSTLRVAGIVCDLRCGKEDLLLACNEARSILEADHKRKRVGRIGGHGAKAVKLLRLKRIDGELVGGAAFPARDEAAAQPRGIEPSVSQVDIECRGLWLH